MIYLASRNTTMDSVNLVAVGSGGWVRFWNTSGHGLAAEFCIFDHYRRTKFFNREIESVTSCTTTCANNILVTGDSLGYIMVNDICCLHALTDGYHVNRYGIFHLTVSTKPTMILLLKLRHWSWCLEHTCYLFCQSAWQKTSHWSSQSALISVSDCGLSVADI